MLLQKINSWLVRQEKINRTIKELYKLNDRDLSDIGINRSDIHRVANEVVSVNEDKTRKLSEEEKFIISQDPQNVRDVEYFAAIYESNQRNNRRAWSVV
jgi:uncharacterized protein YjiS (DUF1127 family)